VTILLDFFRNVRIFISVLLLDTLLPYGEKNAARFFFAGHRRISIQSMNMGLTALEPNGLRGLEGQAGRTTIDFLFVCVCVFTPTPIALNPTWAQKVKRTALTYRFIRILVISLSGPRLRDEVKSLSRRRFFFTVKKRSWAPTISPNSAKKSSIYHNRLLLKRQTTLNYVRGECRLW